MLKENLTENQRPIEQDFQDFLTLLSERPKEFLDRTANLFELVGDSEKHLEAFISQIAEGHTPEIFSNHQSLAEGVFWPALTSRIVEEINNRESKKKFKGFYIPTAASLRSGDQADVIKTFFDILDPEFRERGLFTVDVIRDEDKDKYGLRGSNRFAMRKLLSSGKRNKGIIIYPEGKVEGGRRGENGEIKGMQEVREAATFAQFVNESITRSRDISLLPVGIHGSYRILDPNDYSNPLKIIPREVMQMVIGQKELRPVAQVSIGAPLTKSSLENIMQEPLNHMDPAHTRFLMSHVARLLPHEARGIYA